MKYIALTRLSTKGQKTGTSQETQVEMCQKIAGDKEIIFFHEIGKGWKALKRRPTLLEAIEAIEKRDIFITAHPDRFSRHTKFRYVVQSRIEERGGKLVYADGSFSELRTQEEIIMGHTQSMMSMLEGKTHGRRMSTAHGRKRDRSEAMGFVPYGYRQVGKCYKTIDEIEVKAVIEPDPHEQEILQRMRILRRQGCSYRCIARQLNGMNAFNRLGNPWSHFSVYRILTRIADTEDHHPTLKAEDMAMSHQS